MYSSAFSYVAKTLPGVYEEKLVHENEDAYLLVPERPEHIPIKGLLVAVLDGISSGGKGVSASRAAQTAIQVRWSRVDDGESIEPIEMIYQLMLAAQNAVMARIEGKVGGTTCLLALIRDGILTFGHVGDCQIMLSRGTDGFRPLTQDQTALLRTLRGQEIQRQIEQSQCAEDGLADEQLRDYAILENTLTRYLGMPNIAPDPRQWVEVGQYRLERGDVLLICSDGLLKAITISDLRYVVADVNEEQADALLHEVEHGQQHNRDDITFCLIGVHKTLPAVGEIKQYTPTFNRLLGEEGVSNAVRREAYATITEEIRRQPDIVTSPSREVPSSQEQVLDSLSKTIVHSRFYTILTWFVNTVFFVIIAVLIVNLIWLLQP